MIRSCHSQYLFLLVKMLRNIQVVRNLYSSIQFDNLKVFSCTASFEPFFYDFSDFFILFNKQPNKLTRRKLIIKRKKKLRP